jgi:hypothetical protein
VTSMALPKAKLVRPSLGKAAMGGVVLLVVLDVASDVSRLRKQVARSATDWWVLLGQQEARHTRRAAITYIARQASRHR